MGGTTRSDGSGEGAIGVWLTSAEHAALGDLTSSAHVLRTVSVSVGVRTDVRVVRVGGELASGSAAYLDVVLEQEMATSPRAVIVDLSGTAFVGVRGIAALLRAAGRAAESRTTLCVVSPFAPDFLRRVTALGLTELIDVHRSVDECQWSVAGPVAEEEGVLPARVLRERTGPDDMQIEVEPGDRFVLVRLSGPLSLRTVGAVTAALAKLLLENGRVVVDLTAMRLDWTPALQAFPSTSAAVGGWPTARLVLLDAGRELSAAIRALRIDRILPLAHGLPDARALIDRRPAIVLRYHELADEPGAPRHARALLRSACEDWRIDALVPEATIVVTELVTNAVQHAHTPCRLILRLDDAALHVSVRDHDVADAATLARLRSEPALMSGLQMVDVVARARGVTPHSDGKTVWAVIDRPGTH